MKVGSAKRQFAGLTLPEVLLVLICLGILLAFLLPAMTRAKDAKRTKCSAGLKQVALGFLLWANEHQGKFPMEVSVSEGGSRKHALAGQLVPNFTLATNDLIEPRVLVCPSDRKRKPAGTLKTITIKNISYFLNIDAAMSHQAHILGGDRDVATNGSLVRPGLLAIPDPNAMSWASLIHKNIGNVALVDGSVHQTTSFQLRKLLDSTGITNRLIIP